MKNKLYSCKDFSFSYSGSNECALSHISFTIDEGEFIVVCGKSGCGKTTLLRHLKPSLWGNGRRSGQISFCGVPCEEVSEEEHTRRIGFIFQNCESQFVTDQVWHELAFGLESLGCSSSEIRRRVAEMASYFGLQQIYEQPVEKLSGGQKQLVNLAAIMVMQPEVIILDEPVSQLDPISATEFILMLQRINREFGTTIVITEHRLEELFSICNRIILMDHSHIAYDGSLQGLHTFTKQKEEYLSILPVSMQIYNALNEEGTVPLNLTEGRRWLSSYVEGMDVIACSNRMRQTQPSICSTSVVCIESV